MKTRLMERSDISRCLNLTLDILHHLASTKCQGFNSHHQRSDSEKMDPTPRTQITHVLGVGSSAH